MSTLTLGTTVGQLVVERPGRARIFEQFGIDYCCGGRKPLAQACQEKGIDVETVVEALARVDQQPAAERDWSRASMTELADHIERTHHGYLRRELPRLQGLIDKVAGAHGGRHPELLALQNLFLAFQEELAMHMMKEEKILFPICRQLDAGEGRSGFHCGSVANPIRVMIHEHDNAGDALLRMRELTGGYVPPDDACNTYRALLHSLSELEADMHQHIHKENNILFPRAEEAEQRQCA